MSFLKTKMIALLKDALKDFDFDVEYAKLIMHAGKEGQKILQNYQTMLFIAKMIHTVCKFLFYSYTVYQMGEVAFNYLPL